MGSETYHEPYDALSERTRELHRGIVSLIEELEAIDWYQQRADACADAHLRKILLHNRDEEIEHACLALEWLRRQLPKLDEELRKYLFTEGDVTELEEALEEAGGDGNAGGASRPAPPSQTVGSLRGR